MVACEAVEVGDVLDRACLHQLLAHLLADRFHVHDHDVVNDAFQVTRWALFVGAIGHRLVRDAYDGSGAERAALRQVVDFFCPAAALNDGLDHLGNDFACTLHQHPIADT